MRTPATQRILYDQNCPFCNWYTGTFVRTGFLAPEGRVPYTIAANDPSYHFDRELARNKIALVDTETNTVAYGIDSLLIVLGNRAPWIRNAGQWKPIHFLLERLYGFISYNRKVIAPSDCNDACPCVPEVSVWRRIVFIVLCALLVNVATNLYFHQQLGDFFIGIRNADLLFFALQIPFQWLFFRLLDQRNFYDYTGNLAFVSALGALLLLGFHIGLNLLANWGIAVTLLQPLCFGIILTFMFYEHNRRLKILHLSPLLSFTWIFFRISIYPFAFNL
jgi:hypothetical protein